jgi:predicted TIM-barrel fold metal-dependent hydrolase
MIIDCHVHVYPPEVIKNWEKISEKEDHFRTLVTNNVHKWGTVEDVIDQMEKDNIDQSWIFGFAFDDIGLCRECNDYVMEAVSRYPDRLKGMGVVNPVARGMEEEAARCSEAGLIGLGEMFPQGQGFDLTDRRQTWRIAGLADELGLFLMFHSAEPVGHEYGGKGNVGPKEAAAFSCNHPEVRVIYAHWGGGLWLYELMPEMKLYLQNTYYDTAATPWLYTPHMFDALFAAGVGEKILYGSDFPILTRNRYVKILEQSGINPEQKEMVFGKNAIKFLEKRC